MKSLICYKTKHGATKKYMEWLADEINADIKTFDEISRKENFSDYDTLIVSSGTYVSFMPLNRFLKKFWKKFGDKRVVVVAVGGVPADDPWSLRSYNRIPQKIRGIIKYFKLIGETPENAQPVGYVSPVKKENLKDVIAYINA